MSFIDTACRALIFCAGLACIYVSVRMYSEGWPGGMTVATLVAGIVLALMAAFIED